MAKVTIFTGGNPYSPSGIGSGTTLVSTNVSQTFALTATSQAKFWLAGNGISSVLITTAVLTQGAKSIPVTVDGKQSFYIPATGRWSDYVSISDFTLPGNVTLTVTFETTVNFPTFTDNSVPEDPVIVSATETSLLGGGEGLAGEVLFDVDFEGDFIDSVNGTAPTLTSNFSIETDPEHIIFGSGSGKFVASVPEESPGAAYLIYALPEDVKAKCLSNGFTLSLFWAFTIAFAGLPPYTASHAAQVFVKDGSNFIMYGYSGGNFTSAGDPISYEDMSAMLDALTFATAISGWVDGYQIINGPVWTDEFTPPSVPFTSTLDTRLVEFTFNSTITLTTNPSVGDTLVLKGGSGGDITFTFVDHYPNNSYEIQIGATANDTATSIATAINNIAGAEFTATATDNVIAVTAYSSTFSMEETGSSLNLGSVTHTHDGLLTEEVSVADSFTATDGGKAVQEEISAADNIDGLIDGLSESVNVSDSFDVPLDSLNESVSVSTNFEGLIDVMGAT